MKNTITFLQKLRIPFLAICIFFTSCNGQVKKDFPKEKLRETKGQPKLISLIKDDNVHCSLQDKSGNLWFGTTRNGVYKYDGKLFIQFTTADGLNSNAINHLLEDKDGKIWIATNDGVCLYDPARRSDSATLRTGDKTFTKIQMPVLNDVPSNRYEVWSIMQDKSGKLWFATINGIYIYDGKSFNFFKVTDDTKDCYFKMEYIFEDKAGNFWFGGRCNKGVFRYDGKSITNLKPDGDNWAWPVLQDKNGNIWFSSWKGVYSYDGKSFTKNESLSNNPVTRIIEDKKGNLWFGGDGLSRFDGKSFTRFTTKDGLIHNSIWSILEDRTGHIWIGSRNTGLCRYNGKTFTHFSTQDEKAFIDFLK